MICIFIIGISSFVFLAFRLVNGFSFLAFYHESQTGYLKSNTWSESTIQSYLHKVINPMRKHHEFNKVYKHKYH